MEWWLALIVILGGLVFLMLTGIPVAFAFMVVTLVGALFYWGFPAGLNLFILNMRDSISSFAMLPIPMFVLLGEVMFQSGMGFRMIDVLDEWLGRLPGRLGLLAVGAATLLSTTSGSTIATCAMLGTLLTPEMEKRGYKKPIAIGSIMGSGGLAMIIPPSGIAVLLAAIGEISIGKLLIAGIIPGLIIASLYSSYIILRCKFQPSIAPSYEVTLPPLSKKVKDTVKYVLPLGFIIFLVLGFIFLGIATPTESAAVGALGSIILAVIYRRMNWEVMKKSIMGTVQVSVMTLMIIAAAITFSQILVFSGATHTLVRIVTGLPLAPMLIMGAMQVLLLFLGMFMSMTSIIMITIPIYMPIVFALGLDPVWFGLVMLINLEMATTTPPFGMLLFVMKGVAPAGTTMGDIYKAGIPFLLCDLITILLVMAFPILALWLPSIM